jgi:hypothetical protein
MNLHVYNFGNAIGPQTSLSLFYNSAYQIRTLEEFAGHHELHQAQPNVFWLFLEPKHCISLNNSKFKLGMLRSLQKIQQSSG